MAPKINKKISRYNHTVYKNRSIRYIVIHWVGAVSTAKNNADFFARANRNASAHYFVDKDEIWQSVSDSNAAWAVGGGPYSQGSKGSKYGNKCKNANSISIELCCIRKNGKLIVDPKAITKAAVLVKYLQRKYDIPDSKVIRHYDVTGKGCPGGYLTDKKWKVLRNKLTE